MNTIQAFIKRHALLTYFTLTFIISWGCILLVLGRTGLWNSAQFEAQVPLAVLALLAGPSIASLLLTALIGGRAGLRELGSRLLHWRVGIGWYVFALLVAPLVVTATLLALALISPVFLPAIITASDKGALLLSGIVAGIAGGFLEELGWTGFAAPQARGRFSVLASGLLVGVVWGAWHFPPAMWGSGGNAGAVPLLLHLIVAMFAILLPYRILMVWLYDRTGSLLLAMLMHAALIPSTFYVLQPPATGWAFLAYYLAVGDALWGVVGAVALAHRGHLSRPHLRTQTM
ncbi:MAG: CPBP family intramembrane metalloprotease [Blastochloris sp.]|nr:CPBP family intramembrane metalloprotease [Blastochloris sp.]